MKREHHDDVVFSTAVFAVDGNGGILFSATPRGAGVRRWARSLAVYGEK